MKQQKKQFNCLLSNDHTKCFIASWKAAKSIASLNKVKDINEAREAAAVNPQEEESPDISGETISAMQDVADLNTADSTMTLKTENHAGV